MANWASEDSRPLATFTTPSVVKLLSVVVPVTFKVPPTLVLPEASVTVNLLVLMAKVVPLSVNSESPIAEAELNFGMVLVVPEPVIAPEPAVQVTIWFELFIHIPVPVPEDKPVKLTVEAAVTAPVKVLAPLTDNVEDKLLAPVTDNVLPMFVAPAIPTPPETIKAPVVVEVEAVVLVSESAVLVEAPRPVTVAKVSASVPVTVIVVPEAETLLMPPAAMVNAPVKPLTELTPPQSAHDPF